MTKRVVSVLLAMMMVLTGVGIPVFAEETENSVDNAVVLAEESSESITDIVIDEEGVTPEYAAMIDETGYETLAAAIAAADDNDEVVILTGEYDLEGETINVDKSITIKGDGDLEAVLKNVIFDVDSSSADHEMDVVFDNIKFMGTSRIIVGKRSHHNGVGGPDALPLTGLTVQNCYAETTFASDSLTAGKGQFIYLAATYTVKLDLTVTGNTLINAHTIGGEDASPVVNGNGTVINKVVITGNTLGSEENPCERYAVKFARRANDANITIEDNTVYGATTAEKDFYVLDLWQSGSNKQDNLMVEINSNTINCTLNEGREVYAAYIEGTVIGSNLDISGEANVSNGVEVGILDNSVDDALPEYAAMIGETGYESLEAAVKAVNVNEAVATTITLSAGTHVFPNSGIYANKKIVFRGAEGVVIDATGLGNEVYGDELTFNDLTMNFPLMSHKGITHTNKVVFNNCSFTGTQTLYAPTVEFNSCSFNIEGDHYSVWTYGVSDVKFTECTFNTDGKAILIYHESAHTATIYVTDCEFTAATNRSKAAVELGQCNNGEASYTVIIKNSTADNNFVANRTESNLWGNKNDMTTASGATGSSVTIDNVQVMPSPDPTNWIEVADTGWYTAEATEYTITTAQQLAGVAKLVNEGTESFNGKSITLGENIELAGLEWTPIGTGANKTTGFCGTFDGGNYTISNLEITGKNNNVGMFGVIYGQSDAGVSPMPTVKNLILANVNVSGTNYVGAIAGQPYVAEIYNCAVTGIVTVNGNKYVGGIAGGSYGGTIANSSVIVSTGEAGVVNASVQVGGIIGMTQSMHVIDCTIENMTVSANPNAGGCIGGIVGQLSDGAVIRGNIISNVTINGGIEQLASYGPTTGLVAGYNIAEYDNNTRTYVINNPVNNVIATANGETVTKMSGNCFSDYAVVGTNVTFDDNDKINGGTFEIALAASLIAEGYEIVANTDGTYGVQAEAPDYVAEVNGTQYETVQAAINAAEAGQAVTLLKDTTEEMVTVEAGKNVVVDFAGKKLNGSMLVEKGATADIKNGEIYQTASVAGIEVQGVATLTDMDITSEGRHAIRVDGLNTEGTLLTVNSGTYTTTAPLSGSYYAVNAGEKSTVVINGGKFVGNGGGQGAFIVKSDDTNVTINDCIITNADAIVMQLAAATVINGGNFAKWTAGYDQYLAEGKVAVLNEQGTYDVVDEEVKCATVTTADGTTSDKMTLEDAFAMAKENNGSTITLDENATIDLSDWKEINMDVCSFTLDGNGATITGLSKPLVMSATTGSATVVIKNLTIKDSAITGLMTTHTGVVTAGAFLAVAGYHDVTIENCHLADSTVGSTADYYAGAFVGYWCGQGTLTINKCSVKGSTMTADSSVGGFVGHSNSELTINNSVASGNTVITTGDDATKTGTIIGTALGTDNNINVVEETKSITKYIDAEVDANLIGRRRGSVYYTGGEYFSDPNLTNDGTGEVTADGEFVQREDGMWVVANAQVNDKYFVTIEEAITELNTNGGNFKLFVDAAIADNTAIVIEKDSVIDLNGHTISGNNGKTGSSLTTTEGNYSGIFFIKNANVTICDSSEAKSGAVINTNSTSSSSTSTIFIISDTAAALTIKDGVYVEYNGTSTSAGAISASAATTTVLVEDADVVSKANVLKSNSTTAGKGATYVIDGGTFDAAVSFKNIGSANCTVNGGEFTAKSMGITPTTVTFTTDYVTYELLDDGRYKTVFTDTAPTDYTAKIYTTDEAYSKVYLVSGNLTIFKNWIVANTDVIEKIEINKDTAIAGVTLGETATAPATVKTLKLDIAEGATFTGENFKLGNADVVITGNGSVADGSFIAANANYVVTYDADANTYSSRVDETKKVVEVTFEDGTVNRYVTVKNAIDAANAASGTTTIKLTTDLTGSDFANVKSGVTVILDLGGYTWTSSRGMVGTGPIVNSGNLTIKNGTIKATSGGGNIGTINNAGTLTVESDAKIIRSYSKANVSFSGIKNTEGTVNFYGTIESSGNGINGMGGTVNIYGGSISSTSVGFGVNVEGASAVMNISGGNISGITTAAQVAKGTLNISGGNFSAIGTSKDYTVNCIDENYKNGTAIVSITGGTFVGWNPADNAAEGASTNFCAEGYEAVDNGDGTYGVREKITELVCATVTIGDLVSEKMTLEDAIAMAQANEGSVVTLTESVELPDWTGINANGKEFVLDGAGYTISALKAPLFVRASEGITIKNLTIADSDITNPVENAEGLAVGAVIAWLENHTSTDVLTIKNVKVINTKIADVEQTGGLIGYISGSATTIIEGCEVVDSTIGSTADGSTGSLIGQAGGIVEIIDTKISNNKLSMNADRAEKIGTIIGSVNTGTTKIAVTEDKETTITLTSGKLAGKSVGRKLDVAELIFNGGAYNNEPTTGIVASNVKVEDIVVEENGKFYVKKAVAKIDDVIYGSLQEAIDAAEAGQTVELLCDIEELGTEYADTNEFAVGVVNKTITIDLGGYTLTGSLYAENAELTVKNGVIDTHSDSKASGIEAVTSTLVLEEGLTVTANARHAIRIKGGIATINGGTYKTLAGAGISAYALNAGTGSNETTLVINGGKFYGGVETSTQGTAVMIQTGNVTTTVTGGEFYTGQDVHSVENYGTMTVTGGTFNGSVVTKDNLITGGIFTTDVTKYCAEGYWAFQKYNTKNIFFVEAKKEAPKATIETIDNPTLSVEINGVATDVTLESTYNFIAPDKTGEEALASQYSTWHADFVVSADSDIPANSIVLAGNYGSYGWLAFTNPEAIAAGTKIRLLNDVGGLSMNYYELVTLVQEFKCGVADVGNVLDGVNFTVTLNMYEVEPYANGNTTWNTEKANAQPIESNSVVYEIGSTEIPTNWLDVAETEWYVEGKNEFTLTTAEQMAGLAKLTNEGNTFTGVTIKLGDEIDLAGTTYNDEGLVWSGIGIYKGATFGGTFDGDSYKISNVTFADSSDGDTASEANNYRGFFNHISGATVKNLTVSADVWAKVPASKEYGGAVLVGHANNSTIEGCIAEGAVNGTHNVAGIVVRVEDSNIINCTNKADLTGSYTKMGGIAALVQNSETDVLFDGCVNEGAITSTARGEDGIGGIVGWIGYPNTVNVTVKNCENKGVINAAETATVGQIAAESWNYGHIFEGNKGTAVMAATGHSVMNGLNYATVADGVASYVKDSDLAAGNTYLVTGPAPKPVIKLAEGESITFDKTLAEIDDSGITADSEIEVTTDGNLVTYSVAKADIVINNAGRSLSLNENIYINRYVTFTGLDETYTPEYIAENGGMIIWETKPEDGQATYEAASAAAEGVSIKAGLIASTKYPGEYAQQGDGIVAKKYADEFYFVMYLKLTDGTYAYSEVIEDSVQMYAETVINNGAAAELKEAMAALLHFGAAAQVEFAYNTDDLANAGSYMSAYPVKTVDEVLSMNLVDAYDSYSTDITKSEGYELGMLSVSYDDANKINFYFNTPEGVEVENPTIHIWYGGGTITARNYDEMNELVTKPEGWSQQTRGLTALEYGMTVYARGVFTVDGAEYTTSLTRLSVEKYSEEVMNGSYTDAQKNLAATNLYYGYAAQQYLAK